MVRDSVLSRRATALDTEEGVHLVGVPALDLYRGGEEGREEGVMMVMVR
jgi:hypothetical protein